jgi:hypothetical protein
VHRRGAAGRPVFGAVPLLVGRRLTDWVRSVGASRKLTAPGRSGMACSFGGYSIAYGWDDFVGELSNDVGRFGAVEYVGADTCGDGGPAVTNRASKRPEAPNDPTLVHRHRSRPPREPPVGPSRSPGGLLAPETPGCTSDACPTYGQPSRSTSGPTGQVSTIRGQSHDHRDGRDLR